MKIFNLFSKRQKQLRGEVPDVYQYDEIPVPLRVQIVHIWRDAIGRTDVFASPALDIYKEMHDILCREYGVYALGELTSINYFERLVNFIHTCEETDKILDVIELSFRVIDNMTRSTRYKNGADTSLSPDDAIAELNVRFREHGVGYQYESGKIVRVDSNLLHSEVVKPTLQLLSERDYAGANQEFLKAHEHYRSGRYKECLNECLKSFESTMKIICSKKGWTYGQKDTASKLIENCFSNGLIPSYLKSQFTSLRAMLESGVPTVRNKLSGHGQGSQQVSVPEHFAGYMLHLTATNILFLVESEKKLS